MEAQQGPEGQISSGGAALGWNRVLVVDDERYIRDLVSSGLRIAGFEVDSAADGLAALAAVARFAPSLIILDVGMPGLDGFEVCRRLRSSGYDTPVIFLTARDSAEDRVAGFAEGGDDYVTKPFGLEELVARTRAVLRRSNPAPADASPSIAYADLVIDEDSMVVSRGGRTVRLSPKEFRLLHYLMINRERVVSKQQILDNVWDYDFEGNPSVVENYISYLRKKIDDGEPALLHTVRGFGYVLRTDR